uniref:RNA-directed DNA polymerase, eukaryota, reverse transcriptase zinc-binding domain protein n=1 Tax=Tanacetum cinerariifolium TaxID=118510 RepID=A0A6L2KQI7_TANCI|nr:RNA-directed DNA polymerase, eukaryota, reverse transcriptase zinc-binding domain protein [Tanacetum cinerariifolium]
MTNKVLAAKQFGGLGVSSLFSLNRALLFRWVWRFISRDKALWCRFISVVHGPSFQIRSGPSLWRTITSEVSVLKAQELNKSISVAEKLQHSVEISFRRPVRGGSESAQLELLSDLLECVILSTSCDHWFWDMNGSGVFRVKDVRCMLDDFFLPRDEVVTRWLPYLPIKLNVFAWRLYLDRLPTKSNLIRRGIQFLGPFVVGGTWCGRLVALIPSGFLGCYRLEWLPRSEVYLKAFGMFLGGRFGFTGIWRFFA